MTTRSLLPITYYSLPILNMMNLKCIVVDDDLMVRKALERLCEKSEALNLAGIFENGREALNFLEKESVDLIFLDVEMPELTGIELLNQVAVLPMVIFSTSKTEYAYEAFEFQAIDFIRKPITMPRFDQAVTKALEMQQKRQAIQAKADEIYVREDGRYIRIPCDDILFFENVGDYIRIKTVKGQHIIHGTLKSIEEKLNDTRFLKVHRTYIINLSKIKDIEENSIVIDKTLIPISRAHKGDLMGRLKVL
jgi:DNA-binding LytR/AlgR family response regulator